MDDKEYKRLIKKRSKLAKMYFKNGKTETNLDSSIIISNECTKL